MYFRLNNIWKVSCKCTFPFLHSGNIVRITRDVETAQLGTDLVSDILPIFKEKHKYEYL